MTNKSMMIELTQGQVTQVSPEDYGFLSDFKWCAQRRTNSHAPVSYYAVRSAGVNLQRMHRVILARMLGRELVATEQVDHIDRDPLNNCRENLRLATNSENQHNQLKHKDNASGFKGVSFYKRGRKWRAVITVNYKKIHLGYFDTPEAAAAAYDTAAQSLHGTFACVNDAELTAAALKQMVMEGLK